MVTLDLRSRGLAICVAGVAGFVDVVGFLSTGGFFVSFMSGNTTRLGIGVAAQSFAGLIAAGLTLSFVFGVVAGASLGRIAKGYREPAILTLVTVLLSASLAAHGLDYRLTAIVALALAMGAQNTVFSEDGDVRVGLTYMTGTLVKLGKRITAALWGGPVFGWVWYLALWLGLCGGAVVGGLSYGRFGSAALVIPVVVMLAMAAVAFVRVVRAGRPA